MGRRSTFDYAHLILCFTVHSETQISCLHSHSCATPNKKQTRPDFAHT